MGARSEGSPKPGPLGSDSLLTTKYTVEESSENAYDKVDSSYDASEVQSP